MADEIQHGRPPWEAQQLLRVWLSPSFPVGAYAYSHGLEAAVARGLIVSRVDLEAWLRALLVQGSARTDLLLLAAAWRATSSGHGHGAIGSVVVPPHPVPPPQGGRGPAPSLRPAGREPSTRAVEANPPQPTLHDINALALALQPSAERYLETSQQGGSFVTTCLAAWPCSALAALRDACPEAIAYPVALGTAAAGHGIALEAVLDAAALAFVQNLVSASIRLSVIGQTDGQRVTAALLADIAAAAQSAGTTDLDDLGAACFSSDLASIEHETLATRLFRS